MELVHTTERPITRHGIQVNGQHYWNMALAYHCGEAANISITGNALWVTTLNGELLGKFILRHAALPRFARDDRQQLTAAWQKGVQ